jgi:cytochrome P450
MRSSFDPEHFDIDRDASEYLAFGFATHYCLGARVSSLLLSGIKHMSMHFGD